MGNALGRAARLGRRAPAGAADGVAEVEALARRDAERAERLRAAAAAAPPDVYDLPAPVAQVARSIQARPLDLRAAGRGGESQTAPRRLTAAQRAARDAGRLEAPVLRQVLEEARAAERAGRAPDAAALARKYGADEAALAALLAHASLATVEEARDGRLIARADSATPPGGAK